MNARQLTITAAEWASVQDGTLWLVARGNEHWLMAPDEPKLISATPPVEFVQACAPCETCGDQRIATSSGPGYFKGGRLHHLAGGQTVMEIRCPDCCIELVGPCPYERDHTWLTDCVNCSNSDTITLGHAYAVGQPLLIVTPRGWVDSEGLVVVARPDGRCIVMNEDKVVGEGFSLAHYDLASLPGKWALRLEVVGS